jgi:hypothetical protein
LMLAPHSPYPSFSPLLSATAFTHRRDSWTDLAFTWSR